MPKNRRKKASVIDMADAKVFYNKMQNIEIIPRNTRQEEYLSYLTDEDKKVVFALGPAGTGKTILATLYAIQLLKQKRINKLIITRPAVEVDGERHGFLPGDLNEKMDPWVRPIFDIIEEYFTTREIAHMLTENIIEISPLAYMRGRNFKDAVIILDEAQLTTTSQMKMILTRLANNCRMFVTGDLDQCDRSRTGLNQFLGLLSNKPKPSISMVQFLHQHVERSQVVADVLDIYGDA